MDFLDYLFWKLFAKNLRPSSAYVDRLREYRELRQAKAELLETAHVDFFGQVRELFSQLGMGVDLAGDSQIPSNPQLLILFRQVQSWGQASYRLLLPGDSSYPVQFVNLADPPRGLFVWGWLEAFENVGLAVVGSREPSELSQSWAEIELPRFLKLQSEAVLISGGARGIDQVVHRICLMAKRPTIVFVPSGFDEMYPRDLREWSEAILRTGGLFVSEYSPEMAMRKSYFSERNRLISGLSSAVLCIEARRKSGTLLTAQSAADQGRAVFVLPGHPYDSQCAGNLDLMSEGATMVRDAQELSVFFRAEIRNSYPSLELQPTPSRSISIEH